MLLHELFETASLKLLPNQLPQLRGSYAAFIVSMDPQDFLNLTTPDDEAIAELRRDPFPYSREKYIDQLGREEGYDRYSIPFLKVHFPSGEVFGHEGRHRSIMVQQAGGKRIPVAIYPYQDTVYVATVSYYDMNTDESKTVEELGEFPSSESAKAAMKAREDELSGNEDIWNFKSKIDYRGGGTLKGAPARSEGWERAAWRVEDFPHQLIGQYRPIRVTDYRVGLVKGYRHFSR